MGDLSTYQFPAAASSGVLFGLSVARLGAIGLAGVVFVAATATPTLTSLLAGGATILLLLAAVVVRVGGRPAIDWIPVWAMHGWSMATRNNEFYVSPDLIAGLPDGTLDLPGELFGLELHAFAPDDTAADADVPTVGYGVVRDTFRDRLVAVAQVSGGDFLFLDPSDQQARISAWGTTLDHVAQTLPDVCRLQVVHAVGPASAEPLLSHHRNAGGRGTDRTASSYTQVLAASGNSSQTHHVLLAVALDLREARRAVRQAGGGTEGAVRVLMDRAVVVEEALQAAGLDVHGWLSARAIAGVLRTGFDPAARALLEQTESSDHGGCDPAACGPWGVVDQWAAVRHDSGWSTTLQVVRPPTRPVTGDFLQHLLVGVPAERRMSLLYVPTPMAVAERRAQTQQVTAESEQALRTRWGFGLSARHRRDHADASRREEDLVEGRAVYRVVWMLTVTATTPPELEVAVGHVESAARRCGVELRRMAGTQRQAAAFTLPLCRGAR